MKSPYRPKVDLSGFWKFKLDPRDEGEKEGWFKGFSSNDVAYVPSSWNEQNPLWDGYEGVAWYSTRFYVPESLEGKLAWLIFKGAGYYTKVWLNGVLLGEHEGSFTQFKLDATSAVRFGEYNLLVVRVDNRVALDRLPPGLSINRTAFDFLQYGGIHRPAYLEFTERSYIEALLVETDHKGLLKAEARIANGSGLKVRFKLLEREGAELLLDEVSCNGVLARLNRRVSGVKPWSPEEPNLYTLRVELLGERGPLDIVEERVGFRSFKVDKGRVYLNEKPVFFKGFGRHEDFPVTGKYVPGAALVRDFYLMKKLGANSFRTSHYPYSDEHLDLADEMGFMVILESTVCLSGFTGLFGDQAKAREWFKDPRIMEKAKAVLKEMIEQHRNRPSVVMYSVANEPPTDWEEAAEFVKQLAEYAKSLDPTRPVTFASHRHSKDRALGFVDMISLNVYFGWYSEWGSIEEGVRRMLEELKRVHEMYPDKPVLLAEFGADAVAGIHWDPPVMWSEEYQAELLRSYIEGVRGLKWVAGVHVWNFADFRTPQSPGRTVLNRKGVFTRDRQPKFAAHVIKNLFSSLPSWARSSERE